MEAPHRLKIGITGASGFVGKRLIQEVTRLGHFAVAFSRTPENAVDGCIQTRYFGPPGGTFNGKNLRMNTSGLDAIVHLAGEPIFGRWTEDKKQRILESRRNGTRMLVDAMMQSEEDGPKVLVSASGVGYYGDTGDREIDETTPPGAGFLAEVTQAWEAEAMRAEKGGIRVTCLRIGLVLGRDGGVMNLLRPIYKLGLGAKLGDGRQWVSWIHVSDLARLILFSIENPHVSGPLNATSPNPVTNAELTEALARRFNRHAWFTAPEMVLRFLTGDLADALLESQRVLPRRTEEVGYHCQYKKL